MRVRLKSTGQTGTLPDEQFDPNLYEPIEGSTAPTFQKEVDPVRERFITAWNNATDTATKDKIANAYFEYSGERLGASEKETAEDKKIAKKKAEVDTALTMMENLYFAGKDLSYGRVGGIVQKVKSAIGLNSLLNNYEKQRNSVRPMLVKAAGDVGNFSLPEQQAAIAAIPDGMATPEEALAGFMFTREKLGLPTRDLTGIMDRPINPTIAQELIKIKNASFAEAERRKRGL